MTEENELTDGGLHICPIRYVFLDNRKPAEKNNVQFSAQFQGIDSLRNYPLMVHRIT